MRKMLFIIFLTFVKMVLGCSHTVLVRSDPPGATVFAVDGKGARGALFGVTPLTLSLERNKDYVAVEVRKDGFEATTLVVPLIEASSVDLAVKLKPIDDAWFRERFQKDKSRILSQQFMELLNLQNEILQGNNDEVDRLIASMKNDFAEVSAWHSLIGNYYFLKGDSKQALAYYKKAVDLDPGNKEARSMIGSLTKKGGR